MNRQAIIDRTVDVINRLPEDRALEICDFADFIMLQYEESQLKEGIGSLAANSKTFAFLKEEEDIYTEADLKEKYRDKG